MTEGRGRGWRARGLVCGCVLTLGAMAAWPLMAGAQGSRASGSGTMRDGASGLVSLRWSALSEPDAVTPDYQDLRTRVRWSGPLPGLDGRLHLDGWFRQGWGEDLDDAAVTGGPTYRQRRQLRRLSVEAGGGALGRVELGRHRPPLRTTPALETDGISWAREADTWSVAATAGAPVPYWEPDAGLDTGRLQAGGEFGWHPGDWDTGVGLLREHGAQGLARWRLGARLQAPNLGGASAGARVDVDPADSRWLSGGAHLAWRGGPWWLSVHGTEREVTAFPVAEGDVDSLRYGGRSHELGARLQRRWGRDLTTTLSLRSYTGARELRTETLTLRWRSFGLRRGVLFVTLSDSWSPWRQLERMELDYTWSGLRRWTLSAGAAVTAHEWRTSRRPEWRVRARPQLTARWHPADSWSAQLRVHETMDEFTHLRTGVAAGLTYRL